MLAWLAYVSLSPGEAPYHYKLIEEGGVGKFDKLGLKAWPDLAISKYEVHVQGIDKPINAAHIA